MDLSLQLLSTAQDMAALVARALGDVNAAVARSILLHSFPQTFLASSVKVRFKRTEVEERTYKGWGRHGVMPQLGMFGSGEVDVQGEVSLNYLVVRLPQEYNAHVSCKEHSERAAQTFNRRMFW